MRLVLPLVLLAVATPLAAQDADLPRHRLVFSHHSDPARTDYDVWTVCPDGTQFASVVVEPGHQIQAAVSPDGATIAYVSRPDSTRDIFTRGFWRGEPTNLTDHPADDSGPAWSPDGTQLAFFSTRDAERPELYLLALGSGETERLTTNEFHDGGATWTPDGGAILFTRFFPGEGDEPGAGEIVRLDLETGEETVLTDLGGYNGSVDVSPDGETVAFHRSAPEGADLWVMAADGSDPRPLLETPVVDEYSPAWSPDGRWIAYTAGTLSDNLGTFDLWLVRADGTERRLVSAARNTEAWPTWREGDDACR